MSLILPAKKRLLTAQKSGPRVQDVFNASTWAGTSSPRTINTGIDSALGSLVIGQPRNQGSDNYPIWFDTVRGANKYIFSNLDIGQNTDLNILTSFLSTGYSLGSGTSLNGTGYNYAGWQFRRAEKFFDMVAYTGNGVPGRVMSHSLGIKPGMIIVKQLDASRNWPVYHRGPGGTKYNFLNSTDPFSVDNGAWQLAEPTDTQFTLGSDNIVNVNGGQYIAYLFAHDATPSGMIQCFDFTSDGSGTDPVITGWPAQFVMYRRYESSGGPWYVMDTARSPSWSGDDAFLAWNSASAEFSTAGISDRSDGFNLLQNTLAGQKFLGLAVRRAA